MAFFPGIPRWVAICDGKNVIRLDPRTGQTVGKALTHSDWVTTVVISSDGRWIITGGDGPITVWDISTEKVVRIFAPTSQSVDGMILTQKDRKLVTFQSHEAQPNKLWDLSTGETSPTGNLGGKLFTNPAGILLGGVIGGNEQVVLCDAHGPLQDNWFHSVKFRTQCAALSPDGRLLVLGCTDGGLRFYDLQTHRPYGLLRWQVRDFVQVTFSPDGDTISAAIAEGTVFQVQPPKRQEPDILQTTMNASGVLAYSPNGKTLAVADWDRTIKLVDTQTDQVRTVLRGHRNESQWITFSCDGRMIATLSQGEVLLWDVATGQPRPMQFSGKANYLAFSPTKPLLAIGSETGLIELWDVASAASAGSLRSHARAITALAFSPDGRTLASTSDDEVLHLWDCSRERPPEKPFLSHSFKERVLFLAFLPDGRTLLSGGLPSNTVRFWHLGATALTEEKKPLQLSGISQQMFLSRDGRTLLAPGEGGFVKQWDLSTGNRLSELPTRILAPSPNSDKLAISDAETGMIEVWNSDSWKANHFPGQPLNSLCSLAFSSDERFLFTGHDCHMRLFRIELYPLGQKLSSDSRLLRDAGASIREWNLEDGSERVGLSGPDVMAPPALVALSSDDRTLAAGGEDGCVYLWDRISRRFRQRLFVGPNAESYVPGIEYARRSPLGTNPHYPESVRLLAFCPGKELLVTASTRGVVTLWDSSKGEAVRRFPVDPQQTRWVGFSPGGELAISQESKLQFHDPVSGEFKSTLGDEHGEQIVCVAFSKDGSLVAIADQKHCIHVWDRQTGTKKGELLGHIDQVNALAFTPDSRTLASASNDRTVKLWSVAALAELASLEAHAGNVTCLAFNSAGTILATGGEGAPGRGEVFLWRAPLDRVLPR